MLDRPLADWLRIGPGCLSASIGPLGHNAPRSLVEIEKRQKQAKAQQWMQPQR